MSYALRVIDGWKSFEAAFLFEQWASIYKITGDYIFPKYYKEFKLTKPSATSEDSYDFVLTLNTSGGKKERKELMASVSDAIATMRKNVFSAPFQIAIENLAKGKLDAFKFGIKKEECVYVIPFGKMSLTKTRRKSSFSSFFASKKTLNTL